MWKIVFEKLKDKGLNPYSPGHHTGLCNEKYCVVKDGFQVPTYYSRKLGYKTIDVIIYVPLRGYIEIDQYRKSILEALMEIEGLDKTGNETPVIIDDKKEAYTLSIEYRIMKRLEG